MFQEVIRFGYNPPVTPELPIQTYDLIIVGAGPIGLAAACAAQDSGLNFLILDKGGLCQSLVEFAPRQSFYSPAEELEIGGVPFPLAADEKPRREDALAYYRAVVSSRRLPCGLGSAPIRSGGRAKRSPCGRRSSRTARGRKLTGRDSSCSPAVSGTSPGRWTCPART